MMATEPVIQQTRVVRETTINQPPGYLFTLPVLGNITMWKLVVLQDLIVLAIFGVSALLYPSWLIGMQSKLAGFIGWPAAAILGKSDTTGMLLSVLGCISLALCIPLYNSIRFDDVNFAGTVGLVHIVLGSLLFISMTLGGSSHKGLFPFVVHNLVSALGLVMSLPGKFQAVLGKLHTA